MARKDREVKGEADPDADRRLRAVGKPDPEDLERMGGAPDEESWVEAEAEAREKAYEPLEEGEPEALGAEGTRGPPPLEREEVEPKRSSQPQSIRSPEALEGVEEPLTGTFKPAVEERLSEEEEQEQE